MRILFLTRTWHGKGGLQQLSHDLWREMQREYGEGATVCHPSQPGFLGILFFACRAFVASVKAGRSAHIHLGDASLVPLGVIIRFFTGSNVSVTVSGLDVIYPAWWYQRLMRFSLPRMQRISAISRATAEEVRKRGVDSMLIVVIPCGIHTNNLPLKIPVSHASPRLLSVGRLISRKGFAWFLDEVLPLLLTDFPALTYAIIGEGPERAAIEQIMKKRSLGGHVHMLGAADEAVRDQAMLDADVLIVPNVTVSGDMEGFGIVCIEASARGLPVAAAEIEGLADAVLERETGRFFRGGDPVDAARVIGEMIATPFNPHEIEQATAIHYDWARLFPRYRDEIFV